MEQGGIRVSSYWTDALPKEELDANSTRRCGWRGRG